MTAPLSDVGRRPVVLGGTARRPAVLAAGVIVVIVCVAAGWMLGARLGMPRDDSAEAGFARDMATHHAQAVDLSIVARDKSADQALRTLATDIIVTQSTQRGMFMGWLQQWRLSQASTRPRMAWMPGHAHMGGAAGGPVLMHGMASEAEIRSLENASGVDAEIQFLRLMIRHHEGGVLMARALKALSSRPELVQVATSIDEGQRVEITLMRSMLASRGAQPLPSILDES